MAKESIFVDLAYQTACEILKLPLIVKRGEALLYQVTVDNHLSLTVNPKRPVRGVSAFQTDLCVFERKSHDVVIPRVVIEFKTKITTHDVLTYGAKARKHKQVYPYLRYGIVASDESHVSRRVFTHNESLDFCGAVANMEAEQLKIFFASLLEAEVNSSRCLEATAFGSIKTRLYRSEVIIDASPTKHLS